MSLTQPAHADRTGLAASPVGIVLLGCGTVGSGVARLLLHRSEAIVSRSTLPFKLVAVAVRSQHKRRPPVIPQRLFTIDARASIDDPATAVVVECIGGLGDARDLVRHALARGKHVVTANKDLLATEGPQLRALAAENGTSIAYEAAVGGAIPIVRTLLESLGSERILEVGGVLNGTTNFILDEMSRGAGYERALATAQERGFAEADPTNDVAGVDAAHKLAILSQLAFRSAVTTGDVPRTGIKTIRRDDVALAARLGMVLKLLAVARDGTALVTPAFVRREHPFAQPQGAHNCIRVIGASTGSLTFSGAGAGSEPTASAVVADIAAALRAVAGWTTPSLDAPLRSARPVAPLALRAIVRVLSFRDARPAREALVAAGVGAEMLDGVPALVTSGAHACISDVEQALLIGGIVAESILPLWEDTDLSDYPSDSALTFNSAIAQPV